MQKIMRTTVPKTIKRLIFLVAVFIFLQYYLTWHKRIYFHQLIIAQSMNVENMTVLLQNSEQNYDAKPPLGGKVENGSNSNKNELPGQNVTETTTSITKFSNDTDEKDRVCHIPHLEPSTKEIIYLQHLQFIRRHNSPKCLQRNTIKFKMGFGSKLIRLDENAEFWKKTQCCYKEFHRVDNEIRDWQRKQSKKCFEITNTTTIIPPEHEFIHIECILTSRKKFIYEDYFINPALQPAVETRAESLEDKSVPKLSFIILGMDSSSHMNFIRWMPNVHDYLKNNLNATEFHGLNTFGAGTLQSIFPVLTGMHFDDFTKSFPTFEKILLDDIPFLWKKWMELGYRTSYQEESPIFPQGFHYKPFDYDFRLMRKIKDRPLVGHGFTGSIFHECFGGHLDFEYMLDNLLRLAQVLKDKLFFHMTWTESLSHNVNKMVKYCEPHLLMFLHMMVQEKLLNNTALLLLSDHGMRYGIMREKTEQGYLEERLPFLYVVLPQWFRENYKTATANLELNTKRLTSFLDIHKMILDFTNLTRLQDSQIEERTADITENDDSKGISLFLPIKKNRTCESARISSLFCICLRKTELNITDPRLVNATSFILEEMNRKMEKYSQCAPLSLTEITSAQLLNPDRLLSVEYQRFGKWNRNVKTAFPLDYQLKIVFRTNPGGALWEAVCQYQSKMKKWVMGQIERINAYVTVKKCVPNKDLREYCICNDK